MTSVALHHSALETAVLTSLAFLENGRIAPEGTGEELLGTDYVRRAYLEI